jgi:hypothetical protein
MVHRAHLSHLPASLGYVQGTPTADHRGCILKEFSKTLNAQHLQTQSQHPILPPCPALQPRNGLLDARLQTPEHVPRVVGTARLLKELQHESFVCFAETMTPCLAPLLQYFTDLQCLWLGGCDEVVDQGK